MTLTFCYMNITTIFFSKCITNLTFFIFRFFHFLCATWGHSAFVWGLMLTSTYNLVFITIDRCLKISLPLWYRRRMTPTVAYLAIAFVWMFGNLFEIFAWHDVLKVDRTNLTCVENQDFLDSPKQTTLQGITAIVELIFPMTSLVVLYGIILYKIRRQSRVMDRRNIRDASAKGMKNW